MSPRPPKRTSRPLLALTALLALLPAAGLRAEEARPTFEAARRTGPLQIDGQLDEEAWAAAPVFRGFVQSFPKQGAAPGERTELRVLYDDRNLYVGITCFDSKPELINRQLGRRDNPPQSDLVTVSIDSTHDHRTAYSFTVNAGGTLGDTLLFEDTQSSTDWDAVWEGAAASRPDGWSAELRIPLSLLRFPQASVQTWGLGVRREIARSHEVIDSALIPLEANGFVSRFGHLTGLRDLVSRPEVLVAPYLAARAILRPRFDDPARPTPRLLDPSADLGMDLKASLTSDLDLTLTVNPDFGQVEADQLILNFTTFEPFLPEKRPFFIQGMELFQPFGAQDARSSQMMFYSRRIGLDEPILAAAKLTGTVGGFQLGVLDAVVMGAAAPAPPGGTGPGAPPDQRFQLHPTRPLHLGPDDELPADPGVPRNYLAAVTRGDVAPGATVGATFVSAAPLATRCGPGPLPADPAQREACLVAGGNTAGVDWNLRSEGGTWAFVGQLEGSQLAGGPASGRQLRDGTLLRPGDTGLGTNVTWGKMGGEPFRFDVGYEYASPRLDLSETGYQSIQNEQVGRANVYFVRPSGWGPLYQLSAVLQGSSSWTADGRGIHLYDKVAASTTALLPGFYSVSLEAGTLFHRADIREIPLTGIAYERPPYTYLYASGATDKNLPLSLAADLTLGQISGPPPTLTKGSAQGSLSAVWRPVSWMETQLLGSYSSYLDGPRWVESRSDGSYQFAELDPSVLSLTLRQLVVLGPRLTLQLYAQLFTAYGRYGPFYTGAPGPGGALALSDLRPVAPDVDPSFHESAFNLNVVLRWEYRLGSTLFLVYTRAQAELPVAAGSPQLTSLWPQGLLAGSTTQAFLVKWSYLFGP